jgi:hypothetical protein
VRFPLIGGGDKRRRVVSALAVLALAIGAAGIDVSGAHPASAFGGPCGYQDRSADGWYSDGSISHHMYFHLYAINQCGGKWYFQNAIYDTNGAMDRSAVGVRVWVCATYKGPWTNYFYNRPRNVATVDSPEFQYGSCGLQADTYKSSFSIGRHVYDEPYLHY